MPLALRADNFGDSTIALSPSMLTGIHTVDHEHQALMDTLERMIDSPSAFANAEHISESLSRLSEQLIQHFKNEEATLQTLQMPADVVAKHIDDHNRIVEQITALSFDLMAGKRIAKEPLIAMVSRWVVGHLMEHDLKMRAYAPAKSVAAH